MALTEAAPTAPSTPLTTPLLAPTPTLATLATAMAMLLQPLTEPDLPRIGTSIEILTWTLAVLTTEVWTLADPTTAWTLIIEEDLMADIIETLTGIAITEEGIEAGTETDTEEETGMEEDGEIEEIEAEVGMTV